MLNSFYLNLYYIISFYQLINIRMKPESNLAIEVTHRSGLDFHEHLINDLLVSYFNTVGSSQMRSKIIQIEASKKTF
jgi:hypothetical protein